MLNIKNLRNLAFILWYNLHILVTNFKFLMTCTSIRIDWSINWNLCNKYLSYIDKFCNMSNKYNLTLQLIAKVLSKIVERIFISNPILQLGSISKLLSVIKLILKYGKSHYYLILIFLEILNRLLYLPFLGLKIWLKRQ